jgi:hypothetical protein
MSAPVRTLHGAARLPACVAIAVEVGPSRDEPRRPSLSLSSMHVLADSPPAAYVGAPR